MKGRLMDQLIKKAWKAAAKVRLRAYAPYSKYRVGASLIYGKTIISGCNVENASYGATICAERAAILKATSEGLRRPDLLVVVTSNGASPCAMCLQVISEFVGPQFPIVVATPKKIIATVKLSQLLGFPFRESDLRRKTSFHLR